MNTRHRDLKPGMQILTSRGWRTVKNAPVFWMAGSFLVQFTDGTHEIKEPDHKWVRRINTLNAKERK